jgi:hypothetical protein
MPITTQCGLCKNYKENLKCRAFPQGIPKEILEGKDHTEPFKGDNGIRFEPIEDNNA